MGWFGDDAEQLKVLEVAEGLVTAGDVDARLRSSGEAGKRGGRAAERRLHRPKGTAIGRRNERESRDVIHA
jgi:hypothetical protein